MEDVTVSEFVFISGQSCETFCQDCGQLRLWGKPEKPEGCGNCGSAKIAVGPLLGQELPKLREAWLIERMKFYPCGQWLDTGEEVEARERCGEPERYRAIDNRAPHAHLCREHWQQLDGEARAQYAAVDLATTAREFRLPVGLPTVIIDLSQTEVVLTGGEDD